MWHSPLSFMCYMLRLQSFIVFSPVKVLSMTILPLAYGIHTQHQFEVKLHKAVVRMPPAVFSSVRWDGCPVQLGIRLEHVQTL